jgi:hypothetical protein
MPRAAGVPVSPSGQALGYAPTPFPVTQGHVPAGMAANAPIQGFNAPGRFATPVAPGPIADQYAPGAYRGAAYPVPANVPPGFIPGNTWSGPYGYSSAYGNAPLRGQVMSNGTRGVGIPFLPRRGR